MINLATFNVFAKNQCGDLFESTSESVRTAESKRPSVYGESLSILKKLEYINSELVEMILDKENHFESAIVHSKNIKLHEYIETYFKINHISYVKAPREFVLKGLKDTSSFKLNYFVYKISGSIKGDGIARQLFGAQAFAKKSNLGLDIIFDPYYFVNYQGNLGHFEMDRNRIFIGAHVFTQDIVGVASTLRHEVQHFFEQIKVYKGQMSLARISFFNPKPESDRPYADFLSMDEIETHLRDLRLLLNTNLMNSKDQNLLMVNVKKKIIKEIQSSRIEMLHMKTEIMEQIIKDSISSIITLKAFLETNKDFNKYQILYTKQGVIIEFKLKNKSYSKLKIDLTGLLIPANYILNQQNIENLVNQILDWHLKRAIEIEKEFNLMK